MELYISATLDGGKVFNNHKDAWNDYDKRDDQFKGVFAINEAPSSEPSERTISSVNVSGNTFNPLSFALKRVAREVACEEDLFSKWEPSHFGGLEDHEHQLLVNRGMLAININKTNYIVASGKPDQELMTLGNRCIQLIKACQSLGHEREDVLPSPEDFSISLREDENVWGKKISFDELYHQETSMPEPNEIKSVLDDSSVEDSSELNAFQKQ